MKTPSAKAFTLVELLVVIFVVAVLVVLLLPSLAHVGGGPSKGSMCSNNLKQINIGLALFAIDNQNRFPMQIPVVNGGTMEFIYSGHSFPHFQKIYNGIGNLRCFICPYETNRQAAVSIEALNDLNISYFLNADASTNDPSRTILAGDRFLQVNGQPVKPGLFVLTTNSNVGWISKYHVSGGYLTFADGHTQFSRIDNLDSFIQNQPLATNRLCIP